MINLPPPCEPLYILWNNVGLTLDDCRLACALRIYNHFEDGTPLDDVTIGQIVGATCKLDPMDCTGLVSHLRETKNVYPQVLAGGRPVADWARNAWNKWLDADAAPVGQWP